MARNSRELVTPAPRPRRRWRLRSLSGKLLLPILGLMLVSLLASTAAFVGGTALTRNQLLEQQIAGDAERVSAALATRTDEVATAADLLAHDPEVLAAIQDDTEAALGTLNGRAVVVRDRFNLDLIQLYDQSGRARTNLLLSSLYRESSLLDRIDSGMPAVRVVADRALLLSRHEMPGGAGTVIAGIDLETELSRLVSRYRLSSELGLSVDGPSPHHIGTQEGLPFADPEGRVEGRFTQHRDLALGASPAGLLLVRSTTDIARVTTTGLQVMIGSVLLTTVLLVGLSVAITRSIAQPVQRLGSAAEAVARGDLSQRVHFGELRNPFGIGQGDEIGLLAAGFNSMVAELRDLYGNLEAKVEARTRELATAAEVAYAASSSLDADVVLRMAVELIRDRLRLYFAAILLVEPESGVAVLREATGEAGHSLREEGFQLAVGSRSLVGQAAASRQPCVVQDVTREPNYFAVSQLPDTHSEAAIPLLVGNTVIGVLDVQSQRRDAFTPDVVQILTTLANQIATGVHHARLYEQVQHHAADLEWRVAERTHELAEANQQLAEANERLKELDQLKSKFVFDASHELKSPLTSIKGYGDLLVRGAVGTLTEDQRKFLEIMSGNTERLIALINDLLDMSRIESGRGRQEFEAVALNDVVAQVVAAQQPQAKAAGLALIYDNSARLPAVRGDRNQLVQVVTNLVANAVNYTPAGAVRVRTYCDEARNGVCLEVEDTGMGIEPEALPHIFERFYRSQRVRASEIQGTGLGLAIVKEIVTLHGGEVGVDSTLGEGSTFRVWLPIPGEEIPSGRRE